MASVLSAADRIAVVDALVEGCSLRHTSRMTGVARNAVAKLLVDLGRACAPTRTRTFAGQQATKRPGGQARRVRRLLDVDGYRPRHEAVRDVPGRPRSEGACYGFMEDLAERVPGSFQLTTDGLNLYPAAVEHALGGRVAYAQLVKEYAHEPGAGRRAPLQPGGVCRAEKIIVSGDPDPKHISTSHVERQNLTMRMSIRRFTWLTDAFSKKLENQWAAVSLHFAYYNWCHIHGSLRITPAMAAGLTHRPWSVADLMALLNPAS